MHQYTDVRSGEPEFSPDRESIPDGTYYVIAWNYLRDIECLDEQGDVNKTIKFPPFSLIKEVNVKTKFKYELYFHGKRIRNYLAFNFCAPMSLQTKLIGKDLLTYGEAFSGRGQELIMFRKNELLKQNPKETWDYFSKKYDKTKAMLENIELNSINDIAINLYGHSLWAEDFLDKFLYRFRIIEVLITQRYENLFGRRGKHEGFLNKTEKILGKNPFKTKIDLKPLRSCWDVRNDIIHEGVKSTSYEAVRDKSDWIYQTSRDLIRELLDQGFCD